jgi:hypothetical protein
MRAALPHVAIIVDEPNKSSELFLVLRLLHGKNALYFLNLGLNAMLSDPVT